MTIQFCFCGHMEVASKTSTDRNKAKSQTLLETCKQCKAVVKYVFSRTKPIRILSRVQFLVEDGRNWGCARCNVTITFQHWFDNVQFAKEAEIRPGTMKYVRYLCSNCDYFTEWRHTWIEYDGQRCGWSFIRGIWPEGSRTVKLGVAGEKQQVGKVIPSNTTPTTPGTDVA